MSSTGPKRQHYIPRMLLKHFLDDEGRLCVGDRKRKNIRKTTIHSDFVKKHLYTKRSVDYQLGFLEPDSYEYEEALGRLESNAAPIIDQIVYSVRNGCEVELSEENELAIKEFIFSMARRTPESQARIVSDERFEDIFYETAWERAERMGYPLPSKSELYDDLEVVRLSMGIQGNIFAKFAAGDDDRLQNEVRKFCRETGLEFWAIRERKKSFVIGSHGIGILDVGQNRKQAYLPLAPELCVVPSPQPEKVVIRFLSRKDDWFIRKINASTATCSERIAGRSEALVRSLLRKRVA